LVAEVVAVVLLPKDQVEQVVEAPAEKVRVVLRLVE
jgi:hypothetical protein